MTKVKKADLPGLEEFPKVKYYKYLGVNISFNFGTMVKGIKKTNQ
jgi:hypothetical protein